MNTKTRALVRYQTIDLLRPLGIFLAAVAAVFILGRMITVLAGEEGLPFTNMYVWLCVFLGISGSLSYSVDFKFALQNGMTRSQVFWSTALIFVAEAGIFALVDQVLLAVLPLWGEQSLVAAYGEGFGLGFTEFTWAFLLNLASVFTVYACTAFRSWIGNKAFWLGLLSLGLMVVGFGATLFMVAPDLAESLMAGIRALFGFTAAGVNLAYPMAFFAGITALAALVAFLLIRRAEVR